MSLKNMTEEEKKARKRKQKNEAQKRYYQKNKVYYNNYSKQWSKENLLKKDKEIEKLNKIIEIKNNRIQQLLNSTRRAKIDKAVKLINKKKALFTKDVVQTKIINDLLDILEGEDNKE